jgi:hypothetical protein
MRHGCVQEIVDVEKQGLISDVFVKLTSDLNQSSRSCSPVPFPWLIYLHVCLLRRIQSPKLMPRYATISTRLQF